jgi:hypothetical protein
LEKRRDLKMVVSFRLDVNWVLVVITTRVVTARRVPRRSEGDLLLMSRVRGGEEGNGVCLKCVLKEESLGIWICGD